MSPRKIGWQRLVAVLAWVQVASLGVPGCDRIEALIGGESPPVDDEGDGDDRPAKTTKAPAKPVEQPSIGDPSELPRLERATRKATFPAKGAAHLGFNLDTIDGVRALAGAIEIPEWAVPGTEIRHMRDDDLETAWTCKPESHRPCAIGYHLTTPAEVRAIRLYAAAPGKAFDQHERPAKVRVHTDTEWFDADLADGAQYSYIIFGKPVKIGSLVVEVVDYHGRKAGGMFVAELEVYGEGGTERDPLVIDPRLVVTEFDGKVWSKGHDGQVHGPSFLAVLRDDGPPRRFMPGTALFGRPEDTILLVESLSATDCQTHLGMYYLLNRTTRVLVPIGDLGGMGGDVFRSKDGLGFVAGWADDVDARVTGVVLEGDAYKNRRTQRLGKVTGPAFFDEHGIEREPQPRGGAPTNGVVERCTRGADNTLAELRIATGGKPEAKPGEWMVCELADGARAFLTDHGPCGTSWEVTVLDRAMKLVVRKTAKRKGARLRIRRHGEHGLLVEVGGKDDVTELLRVDAAAVVPLGPSAFAAAPPERCRTRCDDALLNHSKP